VSAPASTRDRFGVGALSGLVGEMNRMSAEHDKRDIDVALDVRRLEGVFRAMAQGVNDMVGAHIALKKGERHRRGDRRGRP
jgi:hypothetical protein